MRQDTDKTCFVIMPMGPEGSEFREQSDDVYERIIKAAVTDSGLDLRCVRSDEINRSGSIIDDIIRYCVKSRFVVADMTRRNPNVFYELGIRHSWANRTILLASDVSDLPFDVNPLRTIIYSTVSTQKVKGARDKLIGFLREMAEDAEVTETDSPVLKLFSAQTRVSDSRIGATDAVADSWSRRELSGLHQSEYWALRDTLYLMGYDLYEYDYSDSSEFRLYWKSTAPHVDHVMLFELPALYKADAPVSAFAVFKRGIELYFRSSWPDSHSEEDRVKLVVYTHWAPEAAEDTIRRLRTLMISSLHSPDLEQVDETNEVLEILYSEETLRNVKIELWDHTHVDSLWKAFKKQLFSEH